MDFPRCETLVTQYLLGQDWQLADARALALDIWQDLSGREQSVQDPVKFIQTQAALHYAVILHNLLSEPSSGPRERAWAELKTWLTKNAPLLATDSTAQDELVQETLIELHSKLAANPLNAPRALWGYLLQTMRHKRTDHHRRATAVKRGDDTLLSLEELNDEDADEQTSAWQETVAVANALRTDPRDIENQVTDQDLRARLQTLFRAHLRSEMQIQVAEAHFLDGLSPQEIAELLGKRPHEIRLIKARVVKILRALPPPARQELYEILEKFEGKKDSDNE